MSFSSRTSGFANQLELRVAHALSSIPHYPHSYDPWIAISSRLLPGWVETHTARPLQARAIRLLCLRHKGCCRAQPALSLQCKPAPWLCDVANLERRLTEQSPHPEWFTSKSLSRSTGVVVTTMGVTRPLLLSAKSTLAKRLIDLKRRGVPVFGRHGPIVKAELTSLFCCTSKTTTSPPKV